MSIYSGWRRSAWVVATIVMAFTVTFSAAEVSFAQGSTPGATAPAAGKSLTEMLIGNAVSGADSGQYKDVTDAITALQNGDGTRARALLEQAVKNNPGKLPPAEVMLARLLFAANQVGPARAELERATKSYGKDPEAYLILAEVALADGRVTDADALLTKAQPLIAAYNENPKRKRYFETSLAARQANVAIARTDWDTAVDRIKDWIKADPDSVQAHQLLGRALFKQGLDRDAYEELQKALKIDSKSTNPQIIMAGLWEESDKNGKHDKAATWIKQAVQEHPKDLTVLLQAAQWALQTSTNSNSGLKEAQGYADQAIALDAKSNEAKIIRAGIARLQNDLPFAEKLLTQVVSNAPDNIGASDQLALVLIETGDSEKMSKAQKIAEVNMQLTAKGNQFSPEVASTYAWVLYKNDRKKEAGDVLGKVLSSTRQLSQDVAYYAGRMLQDQGQFEQAAAVLKAATDNSTPFVQRQEALKLLAEVEKQAKEKSKDKDKDADSKGAGKGSDQTSTKN